MTRLLVASTGGHLAELVLLAPRLSPSSGEDLWVTFDSQQSRTLLADNPVQYVRDTPPRDWRSVIANAMTARRIFKTMPVEAVVSNGAGVALSFLPLARAAGIPVHYIECSARTDGPSLTGRILQRIPGIHLYTQHPELAGRQWKYAGSVFDSYECIRLTTPPSVRKVVITIGTLDFSFRRLLDHLKQILPGETDVVVQAGPDSDRIDWPGARVEAMMAPDELSSLIRQADVVVTHGGVGSALMAFEAGKSPLMIPRRKMYAEHVDDHQTQIARQFGQRGLAVMVDASAVDLDHFAEASVRRVIRAAKPQDFLLR
jgi:UDP-N-acetylglucosamine transferase subunit ALG13